MIMEIRKKILPESFDLILAGKKKCELRLADWKCEEGDLLVLEEWDPKERRYTGRTVSKRVEHVMQTKGTAYWPKEDIEKYGFQIIQFTD